MSVHCKNGIRGGEYWAEIPAMPRCITDADSFAELKVNLVEAIRCWVATQGDLARTVPLVARS